MPEITQDEMIKAAEEQSKKLVEESNGQLKLPTPRETQRLYDSNPVYVNKFMAAMMKNNMVAIGLSVEYVPDQSTFLNSFVCTVNDLAGLHQLVTKLLTTFQQQQAIMMQQLQGKVNPAFVEQVKAMQDAQKGEKPVQKPAEGLVK